MFVLSLSLSDKSIKGSPPCSQGSRQPHHVDLDNVLKDCHTWPHVIGGSKQEELSLMTKV